MIEVITEAINAVMSTAWIYPLIAVLVFADAIIPAFPAEMPINLTGAWAAATGSPDIRTILIVAIIGGILGDNVCFFLGTRLVGWVERRPPRSRLHSGLGWMRSQLQRRAGGAIIIARFIPSARFFLTILLGSMRYNWLAFLIFDALGVVLWASQAVAVGYIGGRVLQDHPLAAAIASVIAGILVGVGIQWAANKIGDARNIRRGVAS